MLMLKIIFKKYKKYYFNIFLIIKSTTRNSNPLGFHFHPEQRILHLFRFSLVLDFNLLNLESNL